MSRNNDVAGYWAIGQLLSHALATRNAGYTIDLMSRTSAPPLTGSVSSLPDRSSELFWTNVERQKLSRATVRRATITIDCDFTRRRSSALHGKLLEHPVQCRVEIEDDRGKFYSRVTEVWCFPHDATVELKSARGA